MQYQPNCYAQLFFVCLQNRKNNRNEKYKKSQKSCSFF